MATKKGELPPMEVDFGDDDTPPAAAQTSHSINGSGYHPSDEELEQRVVPLPRQRPVNPPMALGRILPHSIEAEEYMLSCCFLDGRDVVARCQEAKIQPDELYDGKHSILLSCLYSCYARGIEIDISTIAEELKASRQLDAVGGYAFLTQVSSRIPTTAQAGYFIDKVREQNLLRQIIRSATAVVENAYNFSGGIDEFLQEQMDKIRGVVEGADVLGAPLVSLTDFNVPKRNDRSVLIGNRYLNRGDGAILSGTSGMGKSSMSIQMATLFALGRPAFGMPCNGPLTSLIVQSEDSDGDIGEMRLSIMHALKLSAKEVKQVSERVKIQTERVRRGDRFIAQLRKTVTKVKPDLVWLNPLQAFMDGDVTESRDLGRFLREGLNGINPGLFGYIIVHHTTKPSTGKDKTDRQWHEVMYDMAGGAEIINWARAIMSLRASATEGDFNLVLAKRGRRAGVMKEVEQGAGTRLEPSTIVPLKHAKGFIPANEAGLEKDLPMIFWEGRAPDEPPETGNGSRGRPGKYDYNDYRNIFPPKSGPGMELSPLHRLLISNKEVPKKSLHEVLKKWEEEGMVEIMRPEGKPMRYRAAF